MRQMIDFACAGDQLAGTLDTAAGQSGLLIVSGGNEIRSGAYAGQAAMAAHFAALGFPVFRYDRRGIGDSEGTNGGFESSADDIAAALAAFKDAAPQMDRLIAFGNCDAASALALYSANHNGNQAIDGFILANPWVIEASSEPAGIDAPTAPSAAAIRARYWNRLKNPRSIFDLLTGKIDLKKLAGGLAKAAVKEEASGLSLRIAERLAATTQPVCVLIARHDTTAISFMAAWHGGVFSNVRQRSNITLQATGSASHSFADQAAKTWLYGQIEAMLRDQ
jgi:exosortase A-associated hydrolase 1